MHDSPPEAFVDTGQGDMRNRHGELELFVATGEFDPNVKYLQIRVNRRSKRIEVQRSMIFLGVQRQQHVIVGNDKGMIADFAIVSNSTNVNRHCKE